MTRETTHPRSLPEGGPQFSLLIVDDAELIRNRLSELALEDTGLRLVGTAADGLEAVSMVRAKNPDILLLDVFMPRMDGAEVIRVLRKEGRPTTIVVLTARPAADLFAVISLDPDAILFKESIAECEICGELVAAAKRQDSAGRRAQNAASAIAACRPRLNERETMVLHRLAAGMQVQQIAMDLNGIATRTIELHLHSLREKLDAPTNAAVVARAYEIGLLGAGVGDEPAASEQAA